MDVSNFISPLETVQFISVLSYLNNLSDFLFIKNLINEQDQNKAIPAVNAMYKYLVGSNSGITDAIDDTRLKNLVSYLIRDSDLYGSKEGEILDDHFIQSLFNHLINSLVFNKYGNVYGFLAEVFRTSNSTTVDEIRQNILERLSNEKFQNRHGPDSKLDILSLRKIFVEFILHLFPKTENNISIFSIDYIYAQAGSMFLRSMSKGSVNSITYDETVHEVFNANKHFDEYVKIAHLVEQLVTTRKIDKSALRIFAIPALLHYVHENKEDLQNRTIANIINDPNQWQTAFKQLFSNLSDFFETVDKVQDKGYRYTFLHALQSYKNQSSLARINVKRKCPMLSEEAMEQAVEIYLKCSENCFCNNKMKRMKLIPFEKLFEKQFNRTVKKFAKYEYESIKSVFPEEIKTLMGKQEVEIWRGLLRNNYADAGPGFNARESQAVPEQHDVLEFYNPKTEESSYYALIREDFNVSFIKETDGAVFRDKLNLGPFDYLLHWKFPILLKNANGNFADFLRNIVKIRVEIFQRELKNYKNEELEQSWWKEFLLSLIPFYTCATAVKENNVDLAEMACSLDVFFFIPTAVEVSLAAKELTAGTSRAIQKISLFGIKAATCRLSLRATIRSGSRILMREGTKFIRLITPELFKKVGIAVVRLVDPGFELFYLLGKGSLKSIGKLVRLMENRYPGSLALMKKGLKSARNRVNYALKEIGQRVKFGINKLKKEVFVRSLERKSNSGYGYKFFYMPNKKIAVLRSVREFPDQVPVIVGDRIGNSIKLYRVNPKTGKFKKRNLHLLHNTEFSGVRFKKVHDKLPCSLGKRLKRSPGKLMLCFRTNLLNENYAREEEAVEIAIKNGALSKEQVKNELRNYLFLEGAEKTEVDFVKDWSKNNFLKVPEWSDSYKIDLPLVFHELRYKDSLRESNLNIPQMQMFNINYEIHEAHKLVSYEDFENIEYFMGNYYHKITANPEQGRAIWKSLYRLAIRQSDDPLEEYARILYRGETRPVDVIEELFYPKGKYFNFGKFTSTSTDKSVASAFSTSFAQNHAQVMYEITFSHTYLRARVEKVMLDSFEEETVLLPNIIFKIEDVVTGVNKRGVKTVSVKMSCMHKSKLDDIQNVMKELKKLKELSTL